MLLFFKKTWNQIVGVSVVIIVLLTGFVVPPVFSISIFEGEIDHASMSKFIVAGIILLTLLPCQLFNKKKHGRIWWIIAAITFICSFASYFRYNRLMDNKTGYNKYAKSRQVIGDKLIPIAQVAADSVKKANHITSLTPDELLEHMGDANQLWPKEEIGSNARKLVVQYIFTYILFTLFLLSGIQALYCLNTS